MADEFVKKLTLRTVLRELNEIPTFPVLCFHSGDKVDNFYFAVQNVRDRHLLAVENLAVVLLLDTEFAETLCHITGYLGLHNRRRFDV